MATNATYQTFPIHDFPGGAANSAGAIESGTASAVMGWRSYTLNSATSGSSYGGRFQHYITGAAGSGSALRAYALVKGVAAAQLYGLEATAEIMSTASSDISGEMAAIKATSTVNLSTSGTVSVLNLTINTAASKTMHANSAFITAQNAGSGTDISNLFYIGDAIGSTDNATLVTTAADTTSDHRVKFNAAGTTLWLLACADDPTS
jgi:hypothetical protein